MLQNKPILSSLIIVAFFLAAIIGCSRGPSRQAIISAYERAFNAHQVDSLLILFDNEAQLDLVGIAPPLVGKEMLAGKARYDSTLDAKLILTIKRLKKDTVFVSAVEANMWLVQAGLPPNAYSSMAFVIVNGKIKGVRAELSDSSAAAINEVMGNLIPWAQENEPDKLGELLPQGAFSYNVRSAQISLDLLSAWQNENQR